MKLFKTKIKKTGLLIILTILVSLVLISCSASKSDKETANKKIYKQSELNFDNANVELKDLKGTKISEVRFTSNIDGIFRSVDVETIEKAKELAMNIEMNNEPYEIDDSVDGGIHYDMWFIDGKNVLCVLNNSLGEVSVNDKCYGLDKGEFNKLMHYFANPEVQLKFEKIGFD